KASVQSLFRVALRFEHGKPQPRGMLWSNANRRGYGGELVIVKDGATGISRVLVPSPDALWRLVLVVRANRLPYNRCHALLRKIFFPPFQYVAGQVRYTRN